MLKRIRKYLRSWRNSITKYINYVLIYPACYRKYSKNPINEKKVIFVEVSKKFSSNYRCIFDALSEYCNFDIHIHFMGKNQVSKLQYKINCRELIEDIATSKYVFIDEGYNILGRIKFRSETKIICTWHACGAFKKFGFSTADSMFGDTKKEMIRFPNYRYFDLVTISSSEIIWVYSESMGLPEEKIRPIGVSRTDVFYDKNFVLKAKRKLELFMPSSIGKKVILFAPTFRGRVANATTATAFSVDRFYQELADEYVLIIKHHPHVKHPRPIPEEYQNFAVDFTNTMTIEELLCVADICISDYSSVVFEYSLFERPMIFFDYDIDEYFDWRGFYYDYDELTPGPSFQTNREMIDYIQHIDERFDKQRVIDFKEKFMSSCDGHSTERLMEDVFGEALEQHRKDPEHPVENAVRTFGEEHPYAIKKWKHLDEVPQREEINHRLLNDHPELEGKKLIAYFPAYREQRNPLTRLTPDWQMLFENLDSQYAVIYRNSANLPRKFLPKKYQRKRFVDVGEILTEKEIARVADMTVTDYHFGAGAYCLSEIPTFFYLPDFKWYCADAQDYEESTSYFRQHQLLCEDTKDLLKLFQEQRDVIANPKEAMKAFRAICEHLT